MQRHRGSFHRRTIDLTRKLKLDPAVDRFKRTDRFLDRMLRHRGEANIDLTFGVFRNDIRRCTAADGTDVDRRAGLNVIQIVKASDLA